MMRPQDTKRPEPSRPVVNELSAARETLAVDHGQTWQELKERITAIRRELHKMPVSLIGGSCWGVRIRELEECQRKLELLSAPPSLQLPGKGVKLVLLSGNFLHLHENRPAQSCDGPRPSRTKLSMTS
jgi:hypothetical protein